jgi:general secretion pathway protein G
MQTKTLSTGVRRSAGARGGFTLIELLITIAIVIALGAIVGVSLLGARDEADVGIAQTQLNNIEQALEFFELDYRRVPNEEEGLAVLWDKELLDPDSDETKWKKYLSEPLPKDPWGNDWGYRGEDPEYGEKYDLWSNGPDGEEDSEDDIVAWSTSDEDDFGDFGSDVPDAPAP